MFVKLNKVNYWAIRPIEVMGLIPVKGLTSSGGLYYFISAVTKTFKQESVDFLLLFFFMYRHIDSFKINSHRSMQFSLKFQYPVCIQFVKKLSGPGSRPA